jgi:hypothetical protein
MRDVIFVFGDFNLPMVGWAAAYGESFALLLMNVTSVLKNDLIGDLFGCDMDQINGIPNRYGRFL